MGIVVMVGHKQKLATETNRLEAGHLEHLQLAQCDALRQSKLPSWRILCLCHPHHWQEASPSSLAVSSFSIGQKQKRGSRFVHQTQQDVAKAWQKRKQQTKGCQHWV